MTRQIGLLFTPENRALVRAGLKTETRRAQGLGFTDDHAVEWRPCSELPADNPGHVRLESAAGEFRDVRSPYGLPQQQPVNYYLKEPVKVKWISFDPDSDGLFQAGITYVDTGESAIASITDADRTKLLNRKDWQTPSSSMFMLKSFARCWLPGEKVWVERLGDMTPESAIAEGIELNPDFAMNANQFAQINGWQGPHWRDYINGGYDLSPVQSYATLWTAINSSDPWHPDRLVWAIRYAPPRV